jgi:hypothetical protein
MKCPIREKIIRLSDFKGFPGYDFRFAVFIVVLMVILATCSGCYSPDTVYVREYHQPRPFGASLYLHHNYHHDHYRHSNRRSDRPDRKAATTTTRSPTPPPSRPMSKGVPDPPKSPRNRR